MNFTSKARKIKSQRRFENQRALGKWKSVKRVGA